MSTTRFLLGIICLATVSCRTEPSRSALKPNERGTHRYLKLGAHSCRCEERRAHDFEQRGANAWHCKDTHCQEAHCQKAHWEGAEAWPYEETHCEGAHCEEAKDCHCEERRDEAITIAKSQLGIRELTGKNDGRQVEAYLRLTNLPKGNPWCAAFVSWVFNEAGYKEPRTAWSPALFPLKRNTTSPKPADVLGIYSIRLKRIAHAGLVERRQNDWIISIEGNTNTAGSREGDGVYRKWRHIKTIAKFADWLNEN